MKRFASTRARMFASALLIVTTLPTPLQAQSWTVGQQPVRYNLNVGPDAGTAPAFTGAPADIASNFDYNIWIDSPSGGAGYTENSTEDKFRFTCNFTMEKPIDSILAKGVPNGSNHLHDAGGNLNWSENSDYTTMRTGTILSSGCNGGPVNGSIYWIPALRKQLSGGAYASFRPDYGTLYYVRPGPTSGPAMESVPNGTSFIGGYNIGGPSQLNAQIAQMDADTVGVAEPLGAGWPRGENFYRNFNGMVGWACFTADPTNPSGNSATPDAPLPNQNFQPWLVNANGTATIKCVFPGKVQLQLNGPTCWDRYNRTSPTGRGHMIPSLPIGGGGGARRCPDKWGQTFASEFTFVYSFKSQAEMMQAFLSSDRMNPANTPGDPTSSSPCRKVGPYFCNGETAHFDYIPAWDPNVWKLFHYYCLRTRVPGFTVAGDPNPHGADCNTGAISPTQILKYGTPPNGNAPNPIINTSLDYYSKTNSVRFFPPTSTPNVGGNQGNLVIHHVH